MREKIKDRVRALQRRSPLVKKAVSFAKKRKKLCLCGAAAAASVLAALALFLLALLGGVWVLIAAVSLGAALAVMAYVVNALCKHWIRWEKPTSYFSDLRYRNAAGLALGSTKAWKYVRSGQFYDSEKVLYNCTAYRRSLKMDFAMLKTYHSHVRRGGKVFLIFDYSEAERMGNRILPRDFAYVHPHYFLYTGEKENLRKSAWPILFYPCITVGFVWCKLLKYSGFYRNSTWRTAAGKNMDIDTEKVYRRAATLDRMISFCSERGLEPELILLDGNRDNNMANEILKAYLTPKYYFLNIEIITCAGDLNRAIRQGLAE